MVLHSESILIRQKAQYKNAAHSPTIPEDCMCHQDSLYKRWGHRCLFSKFHSVTPVGKYVKQHAFP